MQGRREKADTQTVTGSDLASLKTATPKLARFLSVQPLNRSFRYSPQKPCKALCGRRCRPLCPARGKQGNPSLSPAYFRTACRFRHKRCENRPKQRFAFAGLVFTRFVAVSRHTGRHRGLRTGLWRQYQCRSFALTSLTSVCSVFMGFGFLGFGTAEGETVPERISINSRTPAGTVFA